VGKEFMSAHIDWDSIRHVARRVFEEGEPLELTEDTRALLRRTARDVGISPQDAEEALGSVSTAMTLLKESMRRIEDGAGRLDDALLTTYDLRDAGDLDGACRLMREVLAVEIVPSYREQAERILEELNQLVEVSVTGRVNPNLPDQRRRGTLEDHSRAPP
jgi:DUSAM domain-containing protein